MTLVKCIIKSDFFKNALMYSDLVPITQKIGIISLKKKMISNKSFAVRFCLIQVLYRFLKIDLAL